MKNLQDINDEKILEENSLFKISKSKIIIKTSNKDMVFGLNKISNIRILKKRKISYLLPLYFIFFIIFGFYHPVSNFLHFILTLVLLIVVISLKSSKNKLIINLGAFSFYKVTLTQKNMSFAESLAHNFKNKSLK